jgi:hypothetical protein
MQLAEPFTTLSTQFDIAPINHLLAEPFVTSHNSRSHQGSCGVEIGLDH